MGFPCPLSSSKFGLSLQILKTVKVQRLPLNFCEFPRLWYLISLYLVSTFTHAVFSLTPNLSLLLLLTASNSVQPHRRQPTRLPCPWDSPGKNMGVGCHFLLQCMNVKSESEVVQSCPTLRDPMDCSPPGSSAHGIFQARVLKFSPLYLFSHQSSEFDKMY